MVHIKGNNNMISDKKLLDFNWSSKMESFRPKQRKKYSHDVLVVSSQQPDFAYVHSFSSEKKARAFRELAREATNNVLAEYEKKEQPIVEKEGYVDA